MTITKFINGTIPTATEFNNNWTKGLGLNILNSVRQMMDRLIIFSQDTTDLWCEAYVDSNGQGNSVKNTSAIFDTDKYKAVTSSNTDPFIIIEATSISDVDDFDINDCSIVEIASGKWLLSVTTTDTDEVKRSKLYKTLFYGTNGTNPRANANYITSITALKTSVARDVGKSGYYCYVYGKMNGGGSLQKILYTDITFADTTSNDNFSSWSYCYANSEAGVESTSLVQWEVPSGTTLNTVEAPDDDVVVSDETGTDTTADELNNPATARAYVDVLEGNEWWEFAEGYIKTYFLAYGSVSEVNTETADSYTFTFTDFTNDNSIPSLTATTEDFESLIHHTIPTGTFSSTTSSLIGKALVSDWESGASIQHKITNATEDSGWITDGEIGSFTAFTSEPTQYLVRLTPKSTSPTIGYPSIKGIGVIAE